VIAILAFDCACTVAPVTQPTSQHPLTSGAFLIADPLVSGNREIGAGIQSLTESFFSAAGLPFIPSRDIEILNSFPPDENDSASACLRAGVDACITPVIEFRGESVRVALRWRTKAGEEIESSPVESPSRELSQSLYQAFVSLMEGAKNRGQIPDGAWNADSQLSAARAVRPQTDALAAYSRGLDREITNPVEATAEYRKALVIDPDFILPYARLFYTCYESNIYPNYAEADILTQTRVRLDAGSVVWLSLAFRDLGVNALRRGWTGAADTFFRRALALLAISRKEATIPGVLALYGLGDIALKGKNSVGALYYAHIAQRVLESLGASGSYLFMEGEIRLGSSYLIDNKTSLSLYSYNRALELAGRLGLEKSAHPYLIQGDLGLLHMRNGDTQSAILAYDSSIGGLSRLGLANTSLYLTLLSHMGNAQRMSGNVREAEITYGRIMSGAKILGLDQSILNADAMYSAGVLSNIRGDAARAQYLLISSQEILNRLGMERTAVEYVPLELLPVRVHPGLMAEEARLLASYCGAFVYSAHARVIQARTYEGRLDDTNVFLKDLLDERKTNDSGLGMLREKFFSKPDPSGRGVIFVDIGPAIANLTSPGVTAVSIARDFPSMTVVAIDLPEQVDIFKTSVDSTLRNRVLAFPNFYVLAGNGVFPIFDQFGDRAKWVKSFEIPADLNGRPFVFRAANSIDIYESWNANREALARIARDFPASPILYLFNRSILFKPVGSSSFKIIGIVSQAGFDHQNETFDRKGDAAYILSPSAL